MPSAVTHNTNSRTTFQAQTPAVTAHVRANPHTAATSIQFHATGSGVGIQLSSQQPGTTPFQSLGVGEWNYLSRFLLPRDIHQLSQTCNQLHAVGQQLLRNVNETSLARAVGSSRTGAAFVNAPPVACLRLSGNCGNAAANLLSPASNVNLLDLRGLKGSTADDVIRLARLHPNARILLNATQRSDLAAELLAQAAGAIALATAPSTAKKDGSKPESQSGSLDPLRAVVDSVPTNLVQTLALEVSTQSTRYANEDAPDFNPAHEQWQTQRMALLASSLLERCQRQGLMADSTRLYLAIEGIRRFTWNTPVHKHQHLLLLSKIALAVEGKRVHDAVSVQGILSAMAIAMDTEFLLARMKNKDKAAVPKSDQSCISPQQVLHTIVSWGVEPLQRNSRNETVLDRLEARGLRQPAHLLKQATTEALRHRSALKAGASLPDLVQCSLA